MTGERNTGLENNYRIIDIHTHTFPEKIAARTIDKLGKAAGLYGHTNATNAELLVSMKKAGISCSFVLPVATSPSQVVKINDSSARLNETYGGEGLFSLGCIHPDFEGYADELRRIRELGMKGIKIHPVYQDVDIDDIRFLRILDCAASLGLAVVAHAGLDIGIPGVVRITPKMSANAVRQIGSFHFVLAHMGGWRNWEEVPGYLAGTGVWLDTSFSYAMAWPREKEGFQNPMLSAEKFMELKDIFGADHILFGSDSPWADQKESLEMIRGLPLTEEEKRLILGENARRMFFE